MKCMFCPVRELCEEVKVEEVERVRSYYIEGAADKVRMALSGYCPLRDALRERASRVASEVVEALRQAALIKHRYKVDL